MIFGFCLLFIVYCCYCLLLLLFLVCLLHNLPFFVFSFAIYNIFIIFAYSKRMRADLCWQCPLCADWKGHLDGININSYRLCLIDY